MAKLIICYTDHGLISIPIRWNRKKSMDYFCAKNQPFYSPFGGEKSQDTSQTPPAATLRSDPSRMTRRTCIPRFPGVLTSWWRRRIWIPCCYRWSRRWEYVRPDQSESASLWPTWSTAQATTCCRWRRSSGSSPAAPVRLRRSDRCRRWGAICGGCRSRRPVAARFGGDLRRLSRRRLLLPTWTTAAIVVPWRDKERERGGLGFVIPFWVMIK